MRYPEGSDVEVEVEDAEGREIGVRLIFEDCGVGAYEIGERVEVDRDIQPEPVEAWYVESGETIDVGDLDDVVRERAIEEAQRMVS